MLNTVLEGVFVGLYTVIISLPLRLVLKGNALFFCTGFLKHFLGYFTGIHALYCNINNLNIKEHTSLLKLFVQSILEGMLFIVIGSVITNFMKTQALVVFFIISALLHIIFELTGVHNSFISDICV